MGRGRKAAVIVAAVLAAAGCTHEIKVQIEDLDGRTRAYETYSDFGARGEVWSCRQSKAEKLKATYTCESVLLQ